MRDPDAAHTLSTEISGQSSKPRFEWRIQTVFGFLPLAIGAITWASSTQEKVTLFLSVAERWRDFVTALWGIGLPIYLPWAGANFGTQLLLTTAFSLMAAALNNILSKHPAWPRTPVFSPIPGGSSVVNATIACGVCLLAYAAFIFSNLYLLGPWQSEYIQLMLDAFGELFKSGQPGAIALTIGTIAVSITPLLAALLSSFWEMFDPVLPVCARGNPVPHWIAGRPALVFAFIGSVGASLCIQGVLGNYIPSSASGALAFALPICCLCLAYGTLLRRSAWAVFVLAGTIAALPVLLEAVEFTSMAWCLSEPDRATSCVQL